MLRRLVQSHPIASATDWGASTTPAPVSTRRTTRLVTMIETWWPAIAVALAKQGPQRPHRRFQSRHQAGQLRVPEYGQHQRRVIVHLAVPSTARTRGTTRPAWSSTESLVAAPPSVVAAAAEMRCIKLARSPYGNCPYRPYLAHSGASGHRPKSMPALNSPASFIAVQVFILASSHRYECVIPLVARVYHSNGWSQEPLVAASPPLDEERLEGGRGWGHVADRIRSHAAVNPATRYGRKVSDSRTPLRRASACSAVITTRSTSRTPHRHTGRQRPSFNRQKSLARKFRPHRQRRPQRQRRQSRNTGGRLMHRW